MSASLSDVIGATLVVFVSAWTWQKWRQRRNHGRALPPGPNGLPVLGNALDLPGQDQWEKARQWGEKYGDVVYANIFGSGFLFLNSYETAVELLEKRGSYYSDRPKTTMTDLQGWSEWLMVLMPYGEELRRLRQLLNKFFQRSVVSSNYCEEQMQSTHRLLARLLKDPKAYRDHVRRTVTESIIKLAFGYEIDENDTVVDLLERALHVAAESVEFSVVNALPALRHLPSWFPGAHFHKVARDGAQLRVATLHESYQRGKNKIADGTAFPSMLSTLMEMNTDSKAIDANDIAIAKTILVVYAAGTDTTISALLTFILAMLTNPEAMRKGQEELDRVVGKNRLPSFEDRPNLPYIEAICAECLRWQPPLPLAVPHLVEKDDIFNGYFVPAGTVVFGNIWAMSRDPKRFPDPDKFLPERWLAQPGKERPLDPSKITFGFGRRICPGRFFAENALFIEAASILSVFDIQKAVDSTGQSITPEGKYLSSFLRHPLPFECSIVPRSDAAAALIHQAGRSA